MPIKKVKLSLLVIDAGTDVRSELNDDVISDYGLSYKAKVKMPPLVVFDCDDEGLILADGFHRYFGCERQGIKEVECDVRKGIRTDAIKYALGANTTHGYRRTNADKRHAVEIALKEFPKHSDRNIATICAVSHTLVAQIRPEVEAAIEAEQEMTGEEPAEEQQEETAPPPRPASMKRKGKDGKEYTVPARPKKGKDEEPKKVITRDGTGVQVPEENVEFWDRSVEKAQRLMSMISEVRTELKQASTGQHINSLHYVEIDMQDCVAKLDQIYADVKRAMPYAVCPDCQGKITKNCPACKGRGHVSKFYWETHVPEEKKAVTGRK